ncbi:nitronate monooxygenase [Streptomyces reniochalinae]|uniref:N-acylglucosamine-6-phosphate 2-epimerase n=1 Tax=Streptomyces reniochalinae TaxID=2250578 RepID=A0A367EQ48_9ACTN|nr:hypothetical protein DQ392_09525 [Streptomyces reniochalinae]
MTPPRASQPTARAAPTAAVIGLDLGGTKTAAALVGPDGAVLRRHHRPTPAREGADLVSSILSGYVPGTPRGAGPDLRLVAALAEALDVPVVAEGRINTPDEAAEALALGAHRVVVGTAITAPTALAGRFVERLARP